MRMKTVCAVLAGIALLSACASLQDRLLYHPRRAAVAAIERPGLRAWPAHDDFRALVAEPPGAARATVVVLHGNAGHAGHRAHYAALLTRLGLRVALAEYPGYGPRDGTPGEAALVADAGETILALKRTFGAPLLVIGESLGAGVAAGVAARRGADIDGLLLLAPWDRLEHVAAIHFPWLPTAWLLHDPYDSAGHLAGYRGRVLVVVAADDTLVPARLGVALHDALPAPAKRLVVIDGAGHDTLLARLDEAWWREAIGFLLER